MMITYLMNQKLIQLGAEEKINAAIKSAGTSIENVVKTAAGVVSLIITVVAGIALLVMCVKVAFKAHAGDANAWSEASTVIATIAAIVCFASAISLAFFS